MVVLTLMISYFLMKTKKIKYLEYKRVKILEEIILNKNNLHGDNHLELINQQIDKEQTILWNYYLKTPISLNNFEEICDIIRYFDQFNYSDRIYEKIQKQLAQLNKDFDDSIISNNQVLEKKISNEIYSLYSIFRLYFLNK